ncbi:MAG: Holliday junction branch migration DNA helicase RuvB [Mycoplasmataceae bacterium]|jgi:Holliday junction DNA helicase RuvB|nr:Holliday junction branch migration DNA helicase RuvB [Mycoplasmataceae bacterium]
MDNKINFRPQTFEEFYGNEEIVDNLKIFIHSAKLKKTCIDHTLIYGLPGTGKTTLASLISAEMNKKIKIIQGNNIQKNSDIINLVLSLNEGDILFIDEIHAINQACIEIFYSVMEDFAIDINIGKDFNSKTTRINIPHFTLIGATTILGKIQQPFQDRFGIMLFIKQYDERAIFKILNNICKKISLNLTENEINKVVQHSKLIPRIAIRLIKRIEDFRNYDPTISVDEIFTKLKIFENGIDCEDIHYLKKLQNFNYPIGIKTISQATEIDINTLETKIEPFLMRNCYIEKTNLGRKITNSGINLIKKIIE